MADSINCLIVVWDGNGKLKAEDGVFLRYLNCVKELFRGKIIVMKFVIQSHVGIAT